jgi:hypothetical protein
VVYATKGGPRKAQQQQQQQQQAAQPPHASVYYLVGPWEEVLVDPSVWGFGEVGGVLQYTVKAATQRLLQIKCSSLPGWVPGYGMRPRLWRDQEGALAPDTALQDLEARHKRKFAEMMQQGFRPSSRSRFSQEAEAAAVHANWMDPSPPRLHPRQRAAAAAAAAAAPITAQRQQQLLLQVTEPAVDDTIDPLLRGRQEATDADTPWWAAYRHASDKRLPRQLRVFGWRLLHAAVRVGGSRVHWASSMQQLLQCCCQQPQCRPAPLPQPQPQQQQQLQQQQLQQQRGGSALPTNSLPHPLTGPSWASAFRCMTPLV